MLSLRKFKATLAAWVLIALTACDSEPAPVQSRDTSQIDEVRDTNSTILDNRKARCDDLLPTVETSEMSKKIWFSLQCPTLYTALAERENPTPEPVALPEEPATTSVQAGEIDFSGALQNISKVLNENQTVEASSDVEADTEN